MEGSISFRSPSQALLTQQLSFCEEQTYPGHVSQASNGHLVLCERAEEGQDASPPW